MDEGQVSTLNSPLTRASRFIFPTAPQESNDPFRLPMFSETESVRTISLTEEDVSNADDEANYDFASIYDEEDDHSSASSYAPSSGDTDEASDRKSRSPADSTNDLLGQSLSPIGLFALPCLVEGGSSGKQSITSMSPKLAGKKLREELTGDDDVFATDAVEAGTASSDNGPATTSELPASATPDSTGRVDAPVTEERIKHLVAEALACHRYSDTRGSRIALQSKINDLGRDVQQLEDSLAALSETVTAHISAGQSGATTEFAKGHARGNSAADSSEVRSKAFISSDRLWSPADPPRASITNTRISRQRLKRKIPWCQPGCEACSSERSISAISTRAQPSSLSPSQPGCSEYTNEGKISSSGSLSWQAMPGDPRAGPLAGHPSREYYDGRSSYDVRTDSDLHLRFDYGRERPRW